MKSLAFVLVLLASPGVHAQMYKCTEGGKTRYSDKPIADCKSATVTVPSPTPAPSGQAPGTSSASGRLPPQAAKKMPPVPRSFKGSLRQDKKGTPPPKEPRQVAKAPPTDHDKKYAAVRCRDLKEEQAWLLGPRGSKIEKRDERLAQVRQALAGCR